MRFVAIIKQSYEENIKNNLEWRDDEEILRTVITKMYYEIRLFSCRSINITLHCIIFKL